MKKIIYIAKNELYTLFYSPIAWILMILFLLLTSADYIASINWFVGWFEKGGENLRHTENLTNKLLVSHKGFLWPAMRHLYILLPIITMGLLSRETGSGTIKLLYSSPVRIREIVLGKYLAIVFFTFCLIILVSFLLFAVSLSVDNPDYGQLVASAFGLFMVLCTYAAIGLFVSSLTSYQIIAGIVTLGIFALLSKIGEFWQEIRLVSNITYYMDIYSKSRNFVSGLLNLRDFTYFLILISGFLMFTIIRMKSLKEYISRSKRAMRYIVVIVIAVVLGYITNRPEVNIYYDTTRDDLYTITPPTQAMLAKLDDGVLEVNVFANLLDIYFLNYKPKEYNAFKDKVMGPYIRFKPDIKVNFIYYYEADSAFGNTSSHFYLNPGKTVKEIAKREAKNNKLTLDKSFLSPEEVHQLVDTKKEGLRCFYQLKYKGKSSIVRTFDDMMYYPSENEMAASINRLIATPPTIGFLSDEIERGPFSERTRDYYNISSLLGSRNSLINQGYDFDTISLKNRSIPDNLAAVVIADPRIPFSPENMEKINSYIDAGGNLFILTEPDRKEIIKPLLEKLGLSLREGMLIEPNAGFSSDCIFTLLTDTAKNISPQFARFLQDETRYFGDTLFRVAMVGASAINYQQKDNFRVDPLLYSSEKTSWNRVAPISTDSLNLNVEKLPTDEQGNFVTAVRMSRTINGREQRIIVTGDADFMSSPQLAGVNPKRYNFNFGFWCYSYFSYGEFPANTIKPLSTDNSFKIKVLDIQTQKLVLYWIIPILIAIVTSVILIRRKRK